MLVGGLHQRVLRLGLRVVQQDPVAVADEEDGLVHPPVFHKQVQLGAGLVGAAGDDIHLHPVRLGFGVKWLGVVDPYEL